MDPKTQLKLQQRILEQEDNLVSWIQDALDNSSYGKFNPQKKEEEKLLEESQFRNLVSVSTSTASAEVVKNFLRYQVGRGEKWGKGKGSLANCIIAQIDKEIKETADKIASELDIQEHSSAIAMNLIRRYLGYGARYLTYLNKGQQ
ncbi:hypothetical protein [Lyngbya confervoides]|uniref:Uncharacterized protein n=1 Tax=Lyngbya confervoides BDU141951 TaxID=1574623 RepID=A0ABD4T6W9_9CYAN|nr:hypothetical protein [Lyngbya confervoides]MCM1984012.1 hypothetical protein [Lyngbya confervoides BDU141951]